MRQHDEALRASGEDGALIGRPSQGGNGWEGERGGRGRGEKQVPHSQSVVAPSQPALTQAGHHGAPHTHTHPTPHHPAPWRRAGEGGGGGSE